MISWSISRPDAAQNGLDRGMIDRRVDDDLGIGAFQGLGADPAQQGLQGLGVGGVGRDLEDAVVLDERVAADRLSLAGDPDHVGVSPADHPPPVVLRADDGPGDLVDTAARRATSGR